MRTSWTPIAALALLLSTSSLHAQQPSTSTAIAITPAGSPQCQVALITTPPATTLRATPTGTGEIQLVISGLAGPNATATVRMVGNAIHVSFNPQRGSMLCTIPFRITGAPAGQRPMVLEVVNGVGALIVVAQTSVVVP